MRRKKFTYPVSTIAGSTPGNIIKLLKRHKAGRGYYFKVGLSFLVSLIFSIFNKIENLIWGRRIQRFKLKTPPVFIIGFNRSGTTLLHNLLCQDPLAGYTTTFHTVFPHCVLTQDWWLAPIINALVPSKRPFDDVPMDMSFPQEEEFALANLQPFSIYNFFLFPEEFDTFVDTDYFTDSLSPRDLERWKREYRTLLVKSLIHTKGVRYIGKNPHHIPRVRILKEMYPGCRFIFIYRDPYSVVESLYQFILGIFPGVQLQHVPEDFARKNVARFYAIAMNRYFEEKKHDSSGSILEIRMEDFMKDKITGLRNIYTSLGLGDFEEVKPSFDAYLEKNIHKREFAYEIPVETIHFVNHYAREIVEKLGYPVR